MPSFDSMVNNPFSSDFGSGFNQPSFDGPNSNEFSQSSDFSSGSIKSARVTSCSFMEMVEQSKMGFRPFISNVTNGDVFDRIPDIVRENRNGAQFKSESMNPFIHDIVSLSSNTLGSVNIVNGWNIRRYSFAIMAEVVYRNGRINNYLIEGFTDTPELSTHNNNVHVDPNMVLHVNNVVSFSERKNTNTGQNTFIPVENYNVITKDPFSQDTAVHLLSTQRPYDVANLAVSGVLVGNASNFVSDARSSISTTAKTSNLSNNNPSTYVSRIINESINAVGSSNTESLFNTTTLRNMISSVAEPSLGNNSFLKQIGKAQLSYATPSTSFTWSDLLKVDPALGNSSCTYLNVFPISNRGIHLPNSGLQCDDINGSGPEQVFASMIANGVSDILARCRATEVSLLASNASTIDQVDVTSMRCFDQNEVQLQSKIFEQLFVSNILKMMNYNTQYGYNIIVQASVWGETFVKINLGFGNHDFLFPNFANSMYSPMITNQKVGTEELSRHLLSFSNKINSEQSNFENSLISQGFSTSPI